MKDIRIQIRKVYTHKFINLMVFLKEIILSQNY